MYNFYKNEFLHGISRKRKLNGVSKDSPNLLSPFYRRQTRKFDICSLDKLARRDEEIGCTCVLFFYLLFVGLISKLRVQ